MFTFPRCGSAGRLARAIAAVCLPFLVALVATASAHATTISTSSVQISNSPAGRFRDDGSSSSSVKVDGDNYAQSFVRPQLGQMGASVSSSVSDGNAFTRSTFDDSWSCTAPCASFPNGSGIVPLSLSFDLDGVVSDFGRPNGYGTGTPDLEIKATYTIGVLGAFQFWMTENEFDRDQGPLGAGSLLLAKFCHTATSCIDLPVDLEPYYDPDPDLDLVKFSVHASGLTLMCPGCAAGFVDEMFLQASSSSSGNVSLVDAFHTFKVTVTSLDPNGQFLSEAGRSTSAAVEPPPVSAAVPEPATLGMVGLGLVGAARRRRRR